MSTRLWDDACLESARSAISQRSWLPGWRQAHAERARRRRRAFRPHQLRLRRPRQVRPTHRRVRRFEVIGERLAAGTHTARPFDPALPEPWGVCAGQSGCAETTADDAIGITYTVPEGWAFGFRAAVTKPSAGTVAPSGMSLHFLRGGWLFTDPCLKVDTLPDIEVGPTADDFADALAAHPLLDVTTPVDVTLGGYSGKYLDLQVPSDISECRADYCPWAPAFYAQGRTTDGTSGASMSTASAS